MIRLFWKFEVRRIKIVYVFGCAVYLIISCDQRIVFTKQTSEHVILSARVYVETASPIYKQIIFRRKKFDHISSLKREHLCRIIVEEEIIVDVYN